MAYIRGLILTGLADLKRAFLVAGQFTQLALYASVFDAPEHHLTTYLTECSYIKLC